MLFAHSQGDPVPAQQGYLMTSRLHNVGVAATMKLVSGSGHALTVLSAVWDDALAFLNTYVR